MDRNSYIRRVTLYRDAKGEYRWRAQAWNWRIVADSGEGYKQREKAVNAALLFANALEGSVEILHKDSNTIFFSSST